MFQQVQIRTNYHEMRINNSKPIYHYILEIPESNEEKVSSAFKQFRPKLIELLGLHMNVNQNIYSPKLIENSDKGILLGSLNATNEAGANAVTLKAKGKITNRDDQNILMSRLFKQVIKKQFGMVTIGSKGQKLFWPSRKSNINDIDIWPGIECILKPGNENNAPTLVIDCAFKLIRKTLLSDHMKQVRDPNQIIGLIVMTSYNKKFYKVTGIDNSITGNSTFVNEQGETISYKQYYQQRYNYVLNDTQLPLLQTVVKGKQDKLEKVIYLIPELCQMTGLTDSQRADFMLMKEMAMTTKPEANIRMNLALEFANQLANTDIKKNLGPGEKPKKLLGEWGLEISNKAMDVQGRRIHPGNMIMGANQKFDLTNQSNLERSTQTQMFSSPQQTLVTALVYKQGSDQVYHTLSDNLKAACQDFKFACLGQIRPLKYNNDNEHELGNCLKDLHTQAQKNNVKVQFVIFLLSGPKKKARLYSYAKAITLQKFGCASQVILENTLKKNTRSIVNKILIQLNAKVGGTPWALDGFPQIFQNQPTMICGTDCFSKSNKKNQLAFCSTTDRYMSKYYSQVKTAAEFTTGLEEIFKGALTAFKEVNNIYPSVVVIYRDGVGDGQQATVLSSELTQYQGALKLFGIQETTKLILILCNKRVNAKFYSFFSGKFQNPPAGTLVDTPKVVETNNPNFYLISQNTKQGTVTPSLYKVVHSDIPNIEDEIKILTFKLCFLFFNFTGSIKTPAPVRYAHCLCNFIGDNYNEKNEKKPDAVVFLPNEDLVKQKVLFYI